MAEDLLGLGFLWVVYFAACCAAIGWRFQKHGGAMAGAFLGPLGVLLAWLAWRRELNQCEDCLTATEGTPRVCPGCGREGWKDRR